MRLFCDTFPLALTVIRVQVSRAPGNLSTMSSVSTEHNCMGWCLKGWQPGKLHLPHHPFCCGWFWRQGNRTAKQREMNLRTQGHASGEWVDPLVILVLSPEQAHLEVYVFLESSFHGWCYYSSGQQLQHTVLYVLFCTERQQVLKAHNCTDIVLNNFESNYQMWQLKTQVINIFN